MRTACVGETETESVVGASARAGSLSVASVVLDAVMQHLCRVEKRELLYPTLL